MTDLLSEESQSLKDYEKRVYKYKSRYAFS